MAQNWASFGQNVSNTATNTSNIKTSNVQTLKPKWIFTTGGDVSARAAVVNGVAYFPDWAGNIYAVNTTTGALIWSNQISSYGLAAGTVSRTSPAVSGGVVYIGTQYNANAPTGQSGYLLAINASTGTLKWMVQPDTSNQFPVITSSPVISGGYVYVGMTSNEEYAASDPSYPCCSVIGSVVAVKASSGLKKWQTFLAPNGYSGANVWGSTPVVDTSRNLLYVGVGNNYSVPVAPAYTDCINGGGTPVTCLASNDYADSIVALNLSTGAVEWSTRLMNWNQQDTEGVANGTDFWNTSCGGYFGPPINCPANPGPDYDFASGPQEITYQSASGPVTIIGAGQKSGIYYALNPSTGALLWQTQVGPGSSLGGMEWGSASDGNLIYVAIANFYGFPNAGGYAGSWAALDPQTGNIVWSVPDPNGSNDLGPMAVSEGVVYAPSMAPGSTTPNMFALNAATGDTLWSYPAGGSVIAGATIAEKTIFWGSGYSHFGPLLPFTGNNQFYAFTLNGH
jgi:polyvinyl alcohol dehydrogenase (cytochrome)